jgi:hypothetical protein
LLVGVPARTVDAAVSELFVEQALATDGRTYTLANRIWIAVLQSGIEPSQLEARHRALAELYRARSDMPLIHHLFAAGRHEEALDEMVVGLELIRSSDLNVRLEQNVHKYAADFPRAIETALKLGRSPRLVHDLRRWLVTLSVAQDASLYWQAAPYFEQLKRDSGFDLWQANIGNGNPAERLTRALSGAHERYLATPEPERVYRVDEAVKNLAEYVASSIAIGVRILDFSLLRSLPALLEPFVPLSPLLDALWQNAIATVESTCHCRFLQARSRWLKVLEKLETVDNAQFQHAATIKNAIASAVGMTEALLGLASAADRVTHLDGDPLQRVNALHLRKVVRLEQGDWNEAARLARQAEEIALRSHVTQMFMSHLRIEMQSRTKARDLVGLKQVTERIAAMAARYPGWVPCLLDAQACFHLVRGDWLAAKLGFERVIELTEPGEDLESANLATWVYAQASHAEVLLRLGDCNAARASATAALETCARRGVVSISDGLVFMLALAETKCGDPHTACARIERLIEQQIEFGVTGLKLGLIYETRAQIAIWSHDEPAFEHFARLTAHQYRYGARCPLGARYDALIHEARRYGIEPAIQVLSLEPPSAP